MAMPSGPAKLGADARSHGQRDSAQQRGHGGHHDGPKAQQAGFVDGVGRVQAALPLPFQSEVDHHDAVLFHDPDQQDDADDRHYAQILFEKNQREQRADAGRRQRGKNGDGMDEALIEHTQNDVYRDQGGENQQRLVGEGILKGSSGSLEAGLHAGGKVQILLPLC